MTNEQEFEKYKIEKLSEYIDPKVLVAVKAAYLAGCVMERWQPIETAPKDETVILLALPPVGALKDEGARRVYEGRWSTIQGIFTSVNGFIVLDIATHWMPLPAPKQIRGGEVSELDKQAEEWLLLYRSIKPVGEERDNAASITMAYNLISALRAENERLKDVLEEVTVINLGLKEVAIATGYNSDDESKLENEILIYPKDTKHLDWCELPEDIGKTSTELGCLIILKVHHCEGANELIRRLDIACRNIGEQSTIERLESELAAVRADAIIMAEFITGDDHTPYCRCVTCTTARKYLP